MATSLLTRLRPATRTARRAVLARRRPLAAALVGIAVLGALHTLAPGPESRTPVLVAARDLAAGTVLRAQDLTRVGFDPASVPDGLAPNPVGAVLAAPLHTGEPVTDVRLVGPTLTLGSDGLVAVPVRLPDPAMADLLRVGDVVDLVAADPQGTAADVVARGVRVLATTTLTETEAASGLTGHLVIVAARPEEVPALVQASVTRFLTFAYAR